MTSGRPSGYTNEIAEIICERLGLGESLRHICSDEAMPSKSMVMRWLASNETFRDQYARARDAHADFWAEQIVDIADDSSGDTITDENGNVRQNSEFTARSRLRVDTRKWLMARMAPKKYGDHIALSGAGGGPIQVAVVRFTEATDAPEGDGGSDAA